MTDTTTTETNTEEPQITEHMLKAESHTSGTHYVMPGAVSFTREVPGAYNDENQEVVRFKQVVVELERDAYGGGAARAIHLHNQHDMDGVMGGLRALRPDMAWLKVHREQNDVTYQGYLNLADVTEITRTVRGGVTYTHVHAVSGHGVYSSEESQIEILAQINKAMSGAAQESICCCDPPEEEETKDA
ncbi:hypothetical protein [Candidatus Poriferisocius sp.]|uniref:hypothetical protein n=1 Tax=Candidatus Poriferisocius sp. TaxID=3101276 RepID=UPI003B51B285